MEEKFQQKGKDHTRLVFIFVLGNMTRFPLQANIENTLEEGFIRKARMFGGIRQILPKGQLGIGIRFQYKDFSLGVYPQINTRIST